MKFLFILKVTIVLVFSLSTNLIAGDYELPEGYKYLIIASRATDDQAVALAKSYADIFPGTQVFRGENGWHPIAIGIERTWRAEKIIRKLVRRGAIPPDSYVSSGTKYIDRVWITEKISEQAQIHGRKFERDDPPPTQNRGLTASDIFWIGVLTCMVTECLGGSDNSLSSNGSDETWRQTIRDMEKQQQIDRERLQNR